MRKTSLKVSLRDQEVKEREFLEGGKKREAFFRRLLRLRKRLTDVRKEKVTGKLDSSGGGGEKMTRKARVTFGLSQGFGQKKMVMSFKKGTNVTPPCAKLSAENFSVPVSGGRGLFSPKFSASKHFAIRARKKFADCRKCFFFF